MMKPLFSDEGLKILKSFCCADTVFAFDYDGTLAPIVADPRCALLPDRTRDLLRELSRFVPIAIISGRRRSEILEFIGEIPDYVIGNHGLEGLSSSSASIEVSHEICAAWSGQLSTLLPRTPGLLIEDKYYSLTIHYRNVSNRRAVKLEILDIISHLTPAPRVVMGKMCVNLIPVGAPHKGIALLEVISKTGSRSAVYIGDDDNDEDVFCLAEKNLLTIRVGKKNDSRALFFIDAQQRINEILGFCIDVQKLSRKPRRL